MTPNRPQLISEVRPVHLGLAAGIAVAFGMVVSVITGDWWLFPLAAAVNALATMGATVAVTRIADIRTRLYGRASSSRTPVLTVSSRRPAQPPALRVPQWRSLAGRLVSTLERIGAPRTYRHPTSG